jgi:ubiquinone/menaquinone biosynthesis C-methylase UbiE
MQGDIDRQNSGFWDELCGSYLARSLNISEISPESLQLFDKSYLSHYPYLSHYVLREDLVGKRVLEIGLGYGTLGQLLASRDCEYFGLDIAHNPVQMMRYRLDKLGKTNKDRVIVGSALEVPHKDESFDYVYSIGCLHHTGNLNQSVSEVFRVLKPSGKAVIMLYNQNSFRQLVQVRFQKFQYFLTQKRKIKSKNFAEFVRSLYDSNSSGEAAPYTDYVSVEQVRDIFSNFSHIDIDVQNFDTFAFLGGRITIHRKYLLNNIARLFGLDLYITATK